MSCVFFSIWGIEKATNVPKGIQSAKDRAKIQNMSSLNLCVVPFQGILGPQKATVTERNIPIPGKHSISWLVPTAHLQWLHHTASSYQTSQLFFPIPPFGCPLFGSHWAVRDLHFLAWIDATISLPWLSIFLPLWSYPAFCKTNGITSCSYLRSSLICPAPATFHHPPHLSPHHCLLAPRLLVTLTAQYSLSPGLGC